MVEAGSNVGSIRDKLTINLGSPDQIWQKNIYKKTQKRKKQTNSLNQLGKGTNKWNMK